MLHFAMIAAFLLLAASRLAAAEAVGMRLIEVSATDRDAALEVSLWYPTAAEGDEVLVGDNAVFYGGPALRDAPLVDGQPPLIVISHGGFRAAPNLVNWLASALASEGFVVAVVVPPALPDGRATPSVLEELWLRPADLSATVTALETDPDFTGRVDVASVGGVGFFLGGLAVLSLAGARIDPAAFIRSCEGERRTRDCAWFAEGGVDLRQVDASRLRRSNLDPRFKAVIAVDPEFIETLQNETLRSISVPTTIVSLGSHQGMVSTLDASALASLIPGARHARIQDAGRFSSFPECKPAGPAILENEGEGDLCRDGTGRSRADIHAELATMIATVLRKVLRPQ